MDLIIKIISENNQLFEEFNGRDLITMIHSIAQSKFENQEFFRKIVVEFTSNPEKNLKSPQFCSNLMWAIAKKNDFWLLFSFKKTIFYCFQILNQFQEVNLGNILWACGEMRFYDEKLFKQSENLILNQQIQFNSPSLQIQALNGFCAFGKKCQQHEKIIIFFAQKILQCIDNLKISGIVEAMLQLTLANLKNLGDFQQVLIDKIANYYESKKLQEINIKQNKKINFILLMVKSRKNNIKIPKILQQFLDEQHNQNIPKIGISKLNNLQSIQLALNQLNINSKINEKFGARAIDIFFNYQGKKFGIIFEGQQGYSTSQHQKNNNLNLTQLKSQQISNEQKISNYNNILQNQQNIGVNGYNQNLNYNNQLQNKQNIEVYGQNKNSNNNSKLYNKNLNNNKQLQNQQNIEVYGQNKNSNNSSKLYNQQNVQINSNNNGNIKNANNVQNVDKIEMSSTLAHRDIIGSDVDVVLPIPFFEWPPFLTNEQKVEFIEKLLRKI